MGQNEGLQVRGTLFKLFFQSVNITAMLHTTILQSLIDYILYVVDTVVKTNM